MDSIYSLSISGNSTRRLTELGRMIPELAIQSHRNVVFFAEGNIDRSDIFMIEVTKKNQKVRKRKIFSLTCRVAALEIDSSNEIIQ